MRDQKKDRSPAKGNGLIGNHFHGISNLKKTPSEYNIQRRILSEMEQTLVCGYSACLRVYNALESKFEGVHNG